MYDELKCCCNNEPYYISAYGLAVKRGYVGTLDEWLESLGMYLHIAYADTLPGEGDEIRQYPAGDFIGICASHYKEAPTDAKDYAWHCIKAEANVEKIAPAWQAGKHYEREEIISYSGSIYSARIDHTSAAEFEKSKWLETTLSEALFAAGVKTSVSYQAQSLTAEEQAQARANIGAMADGATITAAMIANAAVTAAKIADGAVAEAKIASNAVTAAKIASGAITEAKIASSAITNAKIAANAVTASKIADTAIQTSKLATAAVTGAKMNLSNGDLPAITLVPGVHYVNSESELPSSAAIGRIIFVKR